MVARLMQARPRLSAPPSRLSPPPKRAGAVYRDPRWRELVGEIKRERGSICEDCGKRGRVIADHVVELRDGGAAFDKRNIRLRCDPCHGRKTEQARRARAGLA